VTVSAAPQRRGHARVLCRFPAGAQGPRGPQRGACTNLSTGGLFLEGVQLPVGTMVGVFLDHPSLGHFEAQAEVRHHVATPHGMGVQFTRLEPAQLALLQRILATLEGQAPG
jgi:PilZ domain